jgi:hypothetical protein
MRLSTSYQLQQLLHDSRLIENIEKITVFCANPQSEMSTSMVQSVLRSCVNRYFRTSACVCLRDAVAVFEVHK